MMKMRRLTKAFIVLMCIAALLSGALLLLHPTHECHEAACPVCMMLARTAESGLCLLAVFAGMGLIGDMNKHCLSIASENQFVPDWTPVRSKVKLLN